MRLHRIYSPMVAAGHRVILISSRWEGASPYEVVDGIDVYRIGKDWNFPLLCMLLLRWWIKKHQIDIVVEDFNKLPFFTPLISNRPLLVQMHHLWKGSIFREANFLLALFIWFSEQSLRVIYRRSRFCVVSESTSRELQTMGIKPEQIEIIHNGIDRHFYTPSLVSDADHAESVSPYPYIFWLGRLQRYKGIIDAIHAFALIHQRFPEVVMKVAGGGPFRTRAEFEAERLGVADNVEFLGYVTEQQKRELLRQAEVVLQTSWKEGWGLTVVEANACGRVVVAANSPGLRDSVQDKVTGLLYRCGDSKDLADKVEWLLRNPDERRQMEGRAIEWAARFGWEEASRATFKLLQSLLAPDDGAAK